MAAQSITKTVTIVVPYSAGGGTDTVARLIGHQMSRALGQTVLIENVLGAGGTRANERVARSQPDERYQDAGIISLNVEAPV